MQCSSVEDEMNALLVTEAADMEEELGCSIYCGVEDWATTGGARISCIEETVVVMNAEEETCKLK